MACRGVYFALSPEDEVKLLDCKSDDDLIELIQEDIEERWDTDWLAEVDKAWDAIHRCLGDGSLDVTDDPLSKFVLGGRQLTGEDNYTVSYLAAAEVREVAAASAAISESWMHGRYDKLVSTDYDGPHGEDDRQYTWENFVDARRLFEKAAAAGRSMIFTVDC